MRDLAIISKIIKSKESFFLILLPIELQSEESSFVICDPLLNLDNQPLEIIQDNGIFQIGYIHESNRNLNISLLKDKKALSKIKNLISKEYQSLKDYVANIDHRVEEGYKIIFFNFYSEKEVNYAELCASSQIDC